MSESANPSVVLDAVIEAVSMTFAVTVLVGGAERAANAATAAQPVVAVATPIKFRRHGLRQIIDVIVTRFSQTSRPHDDESAYLSTETLSCRFALSTPCS